MWYRAANLGDSPEAVLTELRSALAAAGIDLAALERKFMN